MRKDTADLRTAFMEAYRRQPRLNHADRMAAFMPAALDAAAAVGWEGTLNSVTPMLIEAAKEVDRNA